jgi:hypothetical protein
MKIIQVESCLECPFFIANSDVGGLAWCQEYKAFVLDPGLPPDWCPLEDSLEGDK